MSDPGPHARLYECRGCGGQFGRKGIATHAAQCAEARTARAQRAQQVDGAESRFECTIVDSEGQKCGHGFDTRKKREMHVEQVHDSPETRTCRHCNKVSSSKGHLKTHLKVMHPDGPATAADPAFERRVVIAARCTVDPTIERRVVIAARCFRSVCARASPTIRSADGLLNAADRAAKTANARHDPACALASSGAGAAAAGAGATAAGAGATAGADRASSAAARSGASGNSSTSDDA